MNPDLDDRIAELGSLVPGSGPQGKMAWLIAP